MSRATVEAGQCQVYWIGGSPCAGKSSIANILVNRYGLQSYYCDDYFRAHTQQAGPESQPTLYRLATMTWDEIWLQPVAALLERSVQAYREEFAFVEADIANLVAANERPLLAEGAALMPDLVAPCLSSPHRGIWIVPSESFQRTQYACRPWIQDILRLCSEPERAFKNWMDRDVAFANRVTKGAIDLGLKTMVIDGSRTIDECADRVARHFQLRE